MKVVRRSTKKKQHRKTNSLTFFLLLAALAGITLMFANSKTLLQFLTGANTGNSNNVVFVNANNTPISETVTGLLSVRLTSPWSATAQTAANSVLASTSTVYQVAASSDDVNEDGSSLYSNDRRLWLGTGGSSSWTGMRFNNVSIPQGATITSANLVVYSAQSQWIQMRFKLSADNTGNSQTFTSGDKPSQRTTTVNSVNHSSNAKWNANTWYTINNDLKAVVQEVINRPDWQSGNSLSIIEKGLGGKFGRKYISSADGNSSYAPRLAISYTTNTTQPSPTTAPTAGPTNLPTTVQATNTLMPTNMPYTVSVELAEDTQFSKNYVKLAYTSHPMIATYTFSDRNPGRKTIYARFTASNGQSQVFSNWIDLVAPTTVPTVPPTTGGGDNSHAMGLWNPNPKYDTCPNPADTARIKEIHDSYKVKGPDGKWYPTWHPPVDPATGCKFGHEHGRDPRGSDLFAFAQEVYGYDANNNGKLDADERAVSGIPFGYVNEKLDEYNVANGITAQQGMRHEDHVGHKFEWENNVERDWSTTIGGGTAGGRSPSGIVCDMMMKVHQGTHSKDAFTNNMHEILQFAECSDGMKMGNAIMAVFGRPGEFGGRGGITQVSSNYTPPNAPIPQGRIGREIPDLAGVKQYILVPQGQFSLYSNGIYEDWISGNYIRTPNGTQIGYFDPHFAVFSPSRFYWPGSDTSVTGVTRSAQDMADNVGRSSDLCYMKENGTEMARGGECMFQTNYGANMTPIAWDDPRSQFNGVHREFYFNNFAATNVGSTRIWYSDPFGNNAVTSQFAGSVKQYLQPKNSNQPYQYPFESNALGSNRNYGGNGVHAPN